MNSCFPPLATLNIGENANGGGCDRAKKKNAYAATGSNLRKLSLTKGKGKMASNGTGGENLQNGKIEVLQDLDLYYIKQIAHNLKVIR